LALGEFGQNIMFYIVKDSIQWLSAIAHNGPAIWRAERIEAALWTVLAKEPACRRGVLPYDSTGHPEYSGWDFSQKTATVQDINCELLRALTAVVSAKAGVRVQEPLQICLECRSKS